MKNFTKNLPTPFFISGGDMRFGHPFSVSGYKQTNMFISYFFLIFYLDLAIYQF